jgi:phosphoribosylaminoimidazole carboxylase PurE protein
MSDKPSVLIVLGSKSDEEVMAGCRNLLEEFGVAYDYEICSAHRNPEKTQELAKTASAKGIKVIIAAAGMAAALPGVIASHTNLPVIGVPLGGSALNGIDALLSIVQMPAGVPVATVTIGSHGAKNAALLAIRILSLGDEKLLNQLKTYTDKLARG